MKLYWSRVGLPGGTVGYRSSLGPWLLEVKPDEETESWLVEVYQDTAPVTLPCQKPAETWKEAQLQAEKWLEESCYSLLAFAKDAEVFEDGL